MKKILLAALFLFMCQSVFGQSRTSNISLPLWNAGDTLRAGSASDTSTANSGINSLGLRIDKHIKIIRDFVDSTRKLYTYKDNAMGIVHKDSLGVVVWIEVQDVGGDGNIASEIQNAIDALPSRGGTIYLPAGVYSIGTADTAIKITTHSGAKSAIKIIGAGIGNIASASDTTRGTVLNYTGSGVAIKLGNNHSGENTAYSLSDLHLSGFRLRTPNYAGKYGIFAHLTRRSIFEDIAIERFDTGAYFNHICDFNTFNRVHFWGNEVVACYLFQECDGNSFYDCDFITRDAAGHVNARGNGLHAEYTCQALTVSGSQFFNFDSSRSANGGLGNYAIYIQGCNNATIEGSYFEEAPIVLRPYADGRNTAGTRIIGNQFIQIDTNWSQIRLDASSGDTLTGIINTLIGWNTFNNQSPTSWQSEVDSTKAITVEYAPTMRGTVTIGNTYLGMWKALNYESGAENGVSNLDSLDSKLRFDPATGYLFPQVKILTSKAIQFQGADYSDAFVISDTTSGSHLSPNLVLQDASGKRHYVRKGGDYISIIDTSGTEKIRLGLNGTTKSVFTNGITGVQEQSDTGTYDATKTWVSSGFSASGHTHAGVYLPIADSANYVMNADSNAWLPTWADINARGYLTSETGDISSVGVTSPITGGGSSGAVTIAIQDASADGSTKGAASFAASDFNTTSGNVSIDYTNGTAAGAGAKGFLTSTDWSTFNGKASAASISDSVTARADDYTPLNRIGNRPIDSTSIAANKILKFNGTSWAMGDDNTGAGGSFAYSVSGGTTAADSVRFHPSLKHTFSRTGNVVTVDHTTPSPGLELFDDFISGTAVGNQGWTNTANSGTIAMVTVVGSVVDSTHPGIVSMNTGTVATGSPCLSLGLGMPIVAAGGAMVVEMMVKLPSTNEGITNALSDGTNTYTVVAGLGTSATATVHTDGLFFRYTHSENSGQWTAVVRNNGTETALTTGVTVALSTWYKLRIETTANGGSATFYVNGANATTPSGVNIPRLRAFAPNVKVTKSVGTTARYLFTDYYYISKTLSVAR